MIEKLKLTVSIEYNADSREYNDLNDPHEMANIDFNQFQEILKYNVTGVHGLCRFLEEYFGSESFTFTVEAA